MENTNIKYFLVADSISFFKIFQTTTIERLEKSNGKIGAFNNAKYILAFSLRKGRVN